ncbi:WxL domain-containing protein [Vagococcus silagei]|uniref:WxL domain-containing protein n=1 Tax=Vagococcus silagei TaxID=2508885 RepID=A0A4S3B882_9ENTE|nr:WxL domain-containing protein [Vagococcus silagei]THB62330.1 WxL domain-containing protein [Vagococcus silagei]
MKKTVMSSLLLSGLVLIGVATTVDAADIVVPTEGKVNFVPNTDPPVIKDGATLIKPGTNNQVIELEGSEGKSTTGGLRIGFVPNITFKDAKVSVMHQEYSAQVIKYKYKDTAENKFIAPFVQVIDERGGDKGFKLLVKATKFKTGSDATEHILDNTRIKMYKKTLTNQTSDKGAGGPLATALLSGLNDGETFEEADKTLLTTKPGEGVGSATNNAASSLVFDESYVANTTDTKYPTATSTTEGLKLVVPQGDQPRVNQTYTSTITWTLADQL